MKKNKKKSLLSDKMAEKYANIITNVLNQAEAGEWQQPWIVPKWQGEPCRNIGRKAPYQGVNSVILKWVCATNGYRTPLFLTIDKARELGIRPKSKDEEAWPVVKWVSTILDKDKKKITLEEFGALDEEEQEQCREYWSMRFYLVYNIDQTTMEEDLPKQYKKFLALYPQVEVDTHVINQDAKDEALDYILSTQGAWRCPIIHGGTSAHYSYNPKDYTNDSIHLPKRETFKTTSSYYGTALHEMAHSTKGEPSMRRDYGRKKWGDEGYAIEELVAEFTAAFVCCERGITKTIDQEHVQYVQSWKEKIKEHDVVSTIIDDLMRCVNYELRELEKTDVLLANEPTAKAA